MLILGVDAMSVALVLVQCFGYPAHLVSLLLYLLSVLVEMLRVSMLNSPAPFEKNMMSRLLQMTRWTESPPCIKAADNPAVPAQSSSETRLDFEALGKGALDG